MFFRLTGICIGLLLIAGTGWAQPLTCDCEANFLQLVRKTEEHYAGFPSKVNTSTRSGYFNLLKELQPQAQATSDPLSCYLILEKYIHFFSDPTLLLTYTNRDPKAKTMVMPQELYFNSSSADPMEGYWRDADSSLTLGIRKDGPGRYRGIVVQSSDPQVEQGQLYFTFFEKAGQRYAREYGLYSSTPAPVFLKENLLQVWDQYLFARVGGSQLSSAQKTEWTAWKEGQKGVFFSQLSAKTAYLRLSSFQNNEDQISELLRKQEARLRNSDNLIIDLRGNSGGGEAWRSLLPYILSQPVQGPGRFLRVNPETVSRIKLEWQPLLEGRREASDSVMALYWNALRVLDTTREVFAPLPKQTYPFFRKMTRPRQVALITDRFSAREAEVLVALSRKSDKVKQYGIATAGTVDHDMIMEVALPFSGFSIGIPIIKNDWGKIRPIDTAGFTPDVSLAQWPPQEWIARVKALLEKMP